MRDLIKTESSNNSGAALETALEFESYQLASKHWAKISKEVPLEQEQAIQQQT